MPHNAALHSQSSDVCASESTRLNVLQSLISLYVAGDTVPTASGGVSSVEQQYILRLSFGQTAGCMMARAPWPPVNYPHAPQVLHSQIFTDVRATEGPCLDGHQDWVVFDEPVVSTRSVTGAGTTDKGVMRRRAVVIRQSCRCSITARSNSPGKSKAVVPAASQYSQ